MVSGTALAVLLGALFAPPPAHPIHTTMTDIRVEHGVARITIRAFADDFGRAALGFPATADAPARVPDSVAFAYVRARFTFHTRGGGAVILRWCGQERREDAYLLCLTAKGVAGLAGLRVSNRMHAELYADQVNIVQAVAGRERASLLFLRGDGPKTFR